MMFKTRNDAGIKLAKLIEKEGVSENAIVYSLPKGGVVVGSVVGALLKVEDGVLPVKKITLPEEKELSLGAISLSKNSLYLNKELVNKLKVSKEKINHLIDKTMESVNSQLVALGEKMLDCNNKTAIIVDDGAATGATMLSAIKEARQMSPKEIISCIPVASKEAVELIKNQADRVIVVEIPKLFFSVSQFYEYFPQISNKEAKNLLSIK